MTKFSRSLCLLALAGSCCLGARAQNVGIGTTTPAASAALDITATGKGLLIPRMDSATRAGIAAPPDGLMVFQTDGRKGFWYCMSNTWLYIPDKTRSGDNLGNHRATQTLDLNDKRLTGAATSALGDSTAQVELIANVPSASAALLTRSNFSRLYSRAVLSGYGRGPYGQDIDYAVWGNAYRSGGWGAIFSAGKPGSPSRWVGLAPATSSSGLGPAIRIVDGSQGAGKVLTSDAMGYGVWTRPSVAAATANFDLGPYFLVGNGGSMGLRISNSGNVGIGPDAPRGHFDVDGPGDSYLVNDPNSGSGQSVFLPGHLFLAPYSGTSGTAYVQARVPNPVASTSIGLNLRTTNDGSLVEALQLSANGDARFAGSLDLGLTTSYSDYTLNGNNYGQFGVACPSGTTLVTGGGGHRDYNSAQTDITLNYSGPDPNASTTRWLIRVTNSSGSSRVIRVYCNCARIR